MLDQQMRIVYERKVENELVSAKATLKALEISFETLQYIQNTNIHSPMYLWATTLIIDIFLGFF